MIETVIAVLIVTSLFLALFHLAHLLTGKLLVQHAAMRVARARAVGFNDAVCQRTARACVIPVAGACRTGKADSDAEERAKVAIYLAAAHEGAAHGVLDYEYWDALEVSPGTGDDTTVRLVTDWFDVRGEAGVGEHYTLYMNEGTP